MGGDKIQTRGCEFRGRTDFNSEGGVVCGVSLRKRMEGGGGMVLEGDIKEGSGERCEIKLKIKTRNF